MKNFYKGIIKSVFIVFVLSGMSFPIMAEEVEQTPSVEKNGEQEYSTNPENSGEKSDESINEENLKEPTSEEEPKEQIEDKPKEAPRQTSKYKDIVFVPGNGANNIVISASQLERGGGYAFAPTIKIAGKRLKGWNSSMGGSGATYTGYNASGSQQITTYYAIWESENTSDNEDNIREITFNANDGSERKTTVTKQEIGSSNGRINDIVPEYRYLENKYLKLVGWTRYSNDELVDMWIKNIEESDEIDYLYWTDLERYENFLQFQESKIEKDLKLFIYGNDEELRKRNNLYGVWRGRNTSKSITLYSNYTYHHDRNMELNKYFSRYKYVADFMYPESEKLPVLDYLLFSKLYGGNSDIREYVDANTYFYSPSELAKKFATALGLKIQPYGSPYKLIGFNTMPDGSGQWLTTDLIYNIDYFQYYTKYFAIWENDQGLFKGITFDIDPNPDLEKTHLLFIGPTGEGGVDYSYHTKKVIRKTIRTKKVRRRIQTSTRNNMNEMFVLLGVGMIGLSIVFNKKRRNII